MKQRWAEDVNGDYQRTKKFLEIVCKYEGIWAH